MDFNKPAKGRKPRAPKRPRNTQADSTENVPKRRTRATTLSEDLEIASMYAASSRGSDMSTSYSMPQSPASTSRATATSCAYSPQAHFTGCRIKPRVIQTPRVSSTYFQQSQMPYIATTAATATTSGMTQTPGSYQTSLNEVPRPQLPHLSATAIMLESNTAPGIPEDQVDPGCSTQCQMPEVPTYHAMAERTRAAKKMLENRSKYGTTPQTPDLSIHPVPPQSSGIRYNTKRAIHSPSTSTASTVENYPIIRKFLTRQNQPQSVTTSIKNTKGRSIQTDITITEEEAKLLKILRIKRLDPSKWHINIQNDDYIVTYNQAQEKVKNLNSFHSIVRSSDLIKSSLINFYNNAIQQSNEPKIPTASEDPQYQYGSNAIADSSGLVNSQPTSNILQNEIQKNITQNQQMMQGLLMSNQEKCGDNDFLTNSTTFTQPKVHQPKMSERYQIPTVASNRDFTNYTNPRCYEGYQQSSHGSQVHRRLNPSSPAFFFRFAQFMDPRFLPPAVRQTFEQYGLPGWF